MQKKMKTVCHPTMLESVLPPSASFTGHVLQGRCPRIKSAVGSAARQSSTARHPTTARHGAGERVYARGGGSVVVVGARQAGVAECAQRYAARSVQRV